MKKVKRELLLEAKEILKEVKTTDQETVLFVTTHVGNRRGDVWRTSGRDFEQAWQKMERYLEKFGQLPRWVRIDRQTVTEVLPPSECIRRFARTKRNNYFTKGIAFKKDGSCSFLPEEITGNALLVPIKGHKVGVNFAQLQLDVKNIKGYIKRRFQRVIPDPLAYFDEMWGLFDTEGVVIDEGQVYPLDTAELSRGIRKITAVDEERFLQLTIDRGMDYLFEQLQADGAFIYGYYPAYNKVIPGYNSVRHFSSLYALLETLEYAEKQQRPVDIEKLLEKIENGLNWGLQNLCITAKGKLFVAEAVKNGKELKLGAQAVAILALAKYEDLTGDDFYHQIMVNLLEGLEAFVDTQGVTTHVLNEDLTIKERFRIVYYDGEALFAIMRAYPLTKDQRWLALGERLMDRFVKHGYEKYHDHWLSYSVNELTQYLPKRSYFEFGVKNALQNLDFMEKRDTAYPTFLELLCAANKLFQRIEASEFAGELFSLTDQRRLWEVTEKRALHELRTGVMWPEYGLFFARPETVTHGFYARHDRTRMRIDDAEHFLSGLINYLFLLPEAGGIDQLPRDTEGDSKVEPIFSKEIDGLLLTRVTGDFLQKELDPATVKIADFEYFPSDAASFKEPHTVFIDLPDKRLSQITGKTVKWPDRRSFIEAHHTSFSLLVTEVPRPELAEELPQFIVPDAWRFMYELAELLRGGFSGPVIGITGSVGKSSLRLMLDRLLGADHQVLSNRGNHNTRLAIPLYLDKLVQRPDLLNLEISLNALNSRDRGPLSTLVRPDIAVLTSVDYAHMKGVSDLSLLAKVKSRLFAGLTGKGTAIFNLDMEESALAVVRKAATEQTNKILTYSIEGKKEADLCLVKLTPLKQGTEVTVSLAGRYYTYEMQVASAGMVENSLAAVLVLQALGLDLRGYLPRLKEFRSLPKVMELHSGYYAGMEVDIIDDSHNAAIPSMINGIQAFRDKTDYYPGRKLLVLGQVADLGEQSAALHERLVPVIDASGADLLLAYGEAMKAVVNQTKLPASWFSDLATYEKAILGALTDQSLVLMKGSVSGSDFNKISPRILRRIQKQ